MCTHAAHVAFRGRLRLRLGLRLRFGLRRRLRLRLKVRVRVRVTSETIEGGCSRLVRMMFGYMAPTSKW